MLAAALAGAVFGLLHAVLTVPLGLSQHVSGLGVTLLATSLSYFAYRVTFPSVNTPPTITPFAEMKFLAGIPVIGPVLAGQTPMTLLALAAGAAAGLGAEPHAGGPGRAHGGRESRRRRGPGPVGHPPAHRRHRRRLGADGRGRQLTLAAFNAFFFNMVNGRGWICVALVVFASWRPGKALLGALIFAFFDALQLRLQQGGTALPGLPELPYQVYLMLPYLLSILALVVMARRAAYPKP